MGSTAGAEPPLDPLQRVIQRVSDGLVRARRQDRNRLRTDPAHIHPLVDGLLAPNLDLARSIQGKETGPGRQLPHPGAQRL
jgi:hypothetical protein